MTQQAPLDDLLPFYALDALSDDDKAVVEAALSQDPSLRQTLAEYDAAADSLPYLAIPIQPGTQVKQQLFARLAAETEVASAAPPPLTWWQRLRAWLGQPSAGSSRSGWMPGLALSLSLLALLLSAAWFVSGWGQLQTLQQQNAALQQRLAAQSTALATFAVTLSEVQQQNADLTQQLTDNTTQVAALAALQDENAALQDSLSQQQTRLAGLEADRQTLMQSLADQAEDVETLESRLTRLQEENATLQTSLNTQMTALTDLEAEFAPLLVENDLLQTQLDTQNETLGNLQQTVANLQQNNVSLIRDLTTQKSAMLQVTAPGVQTMDISGVGLYAGAHGRLIANPNNDSAVLLVADLPPLQEGQVYQLWVVHNSTFLAADTFQVDNQGLGMLVLQTDATIADYEAMGVSIEPAGGSQELTNELVMFSAF